jgi:hypothetical protein
VSTTVNDKTTRVRRIRPTASSAPNDADSFGQRFILVDLGLMDAGLFHRAYGFALHLVAAYRLTVSKMPAKINARLV